MTTKEILDPFKPRNFVIKSLNKFKFEYSEEYQRSEVWTPAQKQKLIDSILRSYPIGIFVFIKKGKNKFEVIDGQQRLKTIQEFKKNKWKTSKENALAENKYYKDIEKVDSLKTALDGFKIWYIPISNAEDEQVCDIFIRLQEGTPTNTPEKLNAMKGEIRNLIYRLSKDLKFIKKTSITTHRFKHREILAQISLLEIEFLSKAIFPEFPNLRFKPLKEMYLSHKDDIPPHLKNDIIKTFNFLDHCFKKSAKFITNNGDLMQVYLVASILSKKYSLNEKSKKIFAKSVENFLINTASATKAIEELSKEDIEKDPITHYSSLRSKGQTKENIKTKFLIISNYIFEKLKEAEPIFKKDEKRYFDLCQKIYVYYKKDKGKCQKSDCQKDVNWEDASFHHKDFHSNSGKTIIKNCQLMHKKCHVDFHSIKKDSDEFIS